MVEGSLDLPPIVVCSSRSKSLSMFIVSIVFVAVGFLMLRDPHQNAAAGYLGIAFFGLGIPIFGWRLIRPDTLTLAPDGITWRNAVRTSHWQWTDVQNFRPYSPAARTISKHLGFDFTESYTAQSGRLRQTAKATTGVEGTLGSGWELNATELADLLNKARLRWAGAPPSHRA